MLTPRRGDLLGDKRYITVILRLLLGQQGRLEQGEVVDVDGTSHGRFRDWKGLTGALRQWLVNSDAEPGVEDQA